MSKIEVNTVAPQCGTTLTLGESGDTVTLGSGASQSGFGRTGTVDWDTTIKTATFTATSGEGYFCDTSGGAFTLNLPSSPSVGDIVAIKDYAGTFNTNNLTIGRGGSNMNGFATNNTRTIDNESLTLVYADATKGWLAVEEGTGFIGESFMVASGGTITCCGDFKIHTFTGPGTFTVCSVSSNPTNNTVDYLVIGGGAAGANKTAPTGSGEAGGGGGAGGYRESSGGASGCYTVSPLGACVSALPVSSTDYPITAGGGGSSSAFCGNTSPARNGSNSVFSTITSAGGGGGGARSFTTPVDLTLGANGGSGGGGAYYGPNGTSQPGGTGNVPPVSPPQGQNGGGRGPDVSPGGGHGGGGGGATVAGVIGGVANPGGPGGGRGGVGGAGATSSINGTPTGRAGGGGGGGNNVDYPNGSGGSATDGGGGGSSRPDSGVNGTTNTGGGGGGGSGGGSSPGPGATGQGGSGIVIIRYKFQ